jgi:hypothetical protein
MQEDLSEISSEDLAAELSRRQTAEQRAAAAAELALLAPFVSLGFGSASTNLTAASLVNGLREQRAASLDKTWASYLACAIQGLDGLQETVGGRILYLQSVVDAAPETDEPVT